MTSTANTESPRVVRPDDWQFADVPFAQLYPATYVEWAAPGLDDPLRLAVVDTAPDGAINGTFLLLHGEPSWSVLYEQWLGPMTAAGYRCVTVDLPGFGRSDKPTEDSWYTHDRFCAALTHMVDSLGLEDIHLVVQDWAGPIGLRHAVDHPDAYRRLFIFNTWLHHPGYEYAEGARRWHRAATDPDRLGGDMPTGKVVADTLHRPDHDLRAVQATFDAPFTDATSKAGARAFPAMLPFADPVRGGADAQAHCYDELRTWDHCSVHLAFADNDSVFPYEHGAAWAADVPGATIDRIVNSGHFVQYDAPADCLAVVARHLGRHE